MCLEFLGSEIINAFQQRLEAPGLEMGSGRPAILAGHLSASLQRPGDTARQFFTAVVVSQRGTGTSNLPGCMSGTLCMLVFSVNQQINHCKWSQKKKVFRNLLVNSNSIRSQYMLVWDDVQTPPFISAKPRHVTIHTVLAAPIRNAKIKTSNETTCLQHCLWPRVY